MANQKAYKDFIVCPSCDEEYSAKNRVCITCFDCASCCTCKKPNHIPGNQAKNIAIKQASI